MMKILNFLERVGGIDISFGGCFHSKKKKKHETYAARFGSFWGSFRRGPRPNVVRPSNL